MFTKQDEQNKLSMKVTIEFKHNASLDSMKGIDSIMQYAKHDIKEFINSDTKHDIHILHNDVTGRSEAYIILDKM